MKSGKSEDRTSFAFLPALVAILESKILSMWISRANWNPDFMKLGAKKAIEIIRQHGSLEEITTAEKLYQELKEIY